MKTLNKSVFSEIRRNTPRGKFILSFLVSLFVVLVVQLLYMGGQLSSIEQLQADWRRSSFTGGNPANHVVLVNVTDECLDIIAQEYMLTWPWPRESYAIMLNYLKDLQTGPAVFDFHFIDYSRFGVADDASFATAISNYGPVVFATTFADSMTDPQAKKRFTDFSREKPDEVPFLMAEQRGVSQRIQHLALKVDDAAGIIPEYLIAREIPTSDFIPVLHGLGNASVIFDSDGVVRRKNQLLMHQGAYYPDLSLSAVIAALDIQTVQTAPNAIILSAKDGRVYTIPVNSDASTLIKYYGGLETSLRKKFLVELRASDIIRASYGIESAAARVKEKVFENAVVLFGSSAVALYDLRPNPFEPRDPGSFIHASTINNILNQDYIREEKSPLLLLGITLLLTTLSALASARLSILKNTLLQLLMLTLYTASGAFLYAEMGILLEMTAVQLALLSTFLLATITNYFQESRQKKFIEGAFSQLLAPSVLDNLLNDSGQLTLGGENKELTIFFSDLAGFTTISEQLGSPQKLVEILNIYLTAMADIIMDYDGYVDKYEGDAIMAFWGAPLDDPDQHWKGCYAALDNVKKLEELQEQLRSLGLSEKLGMRIGLNSGMAVAGMMGSLKKLNYTIIGDSVNLASRLEGANKMYESSILISDATFKAAENRIVARPLDSIRVKGKNVPVKVYELRARKGDENEKDRAMVQVFNEGIQLFEKRRFAEAKQLFSDNLHKYPDDLPSKLYIERCTLYITNPPDDAWDGVFTLTSK